LANVTGQPVPESLIEPLVDQNESGGFLEFEFGGVAEGVEDAGDKGR